MQSISTQGRVEGELLVIKDGWEVVVSVNATDLWNFYWIIEIILSSLSTDYFYVKILRWAQCFFIFLSLTSVFDPPLLSHACAF